MKSRFEVFQKDFVAFLFLGFIGIPVEPYGP